MPRRKKERGRPLHRKYPPRIDATPEEIAEAMFSVPISRIRELESKTEYRCVDCGEEVNYPDTLYNDGKCETCHFSVPV